MNWQRVRKWKKYCGRHNYGFKQVDILSHTLSGLAIGTVVASFGKGFRQKSLILLTASIGAALPDLDAISMWSGFDRSIGSWFGLPLSGPEIYSSKLWYAHHGFMHSLAASLFLAYIFTALGLGIKTLWTLASKSKLKLDFPKYKLSLSAFILGYWIHLLEDLPTPSATWGGVNLFWPASSYTGGWGKIWWWNNYDIFLLILAVIALNLLLAGLNYWRSFAIRKMSLIVFCIGFMIASFQINSRDFDFSYHGACPDYALYEARSREIQKEILGEKVFRLMEGFDHSISIYF